MTTRFLKAAGTLAVALVFLAGFTPITAPDGLASASPSAATGAALTIVGPSSVAAGCSGTFTVYSGRPGTWSVTSGGGIIATGTVPGGQYATIGFGGASSATVTWTSATLVYTKTVTITAGTDPPSCPE